MMYLISSQNRRSRKGNPSEILNLSEELENFNLEVPNIVKLFDSLKNQGINLGSPITVEEASKLLVQAMKIYK